MSPDFLAGLAGPAIGGAVSIVVMVVGYLVKRSIDGIDDHLHVQDGKIDALISSRSIHGEAIVELRTRVASLEAERAVTRAEHNQFAGFLQRLGFQRSEGEGG